MPLLQNSARFIRRHFPWVAIICVLVLLALAFEAGRYSVYQAHPELSGVEQANQILKRVGDLIQLPTGESPTMATIRDATAVKKVQPFLTNAENGDVLIVYPAAAEAILYRPGTNKLITVGPVDNGANAPQFQSPPSTDTGQAASSTNDASSTKSKK